MTGRVLFYVQHLLGVGHVKRSAAVARGLARAGHDVVVALGGEPVPYADFSGTKVVQLASARSKDVNFSVLVDEAGRPIDDDWKAGRRGELLSLFDEFDPDVLLVEHFPFGRRAFRFELIPLFEGAKGRSAIVCSVRDVLVAKSDPKRLSWMVDTARQWFDMILVHGDDALIPFDATFPRAAELAALIRYTGYVCDNSTIRKTEAASDRLAGEVIVSIGGGAVGAELLEAALGARRSGTLADRHWRLLAGRHLDTGIFEQLCNNAPDNVTIEWARPDFPHLLSQASLSISQAGYNTLMDILAARCKSIVVPFAAGAESEQLFRARRFEQLELLHVLEENALTEQSLGALAEHVGNMPAKHHDSSIDLSGVETTAQVITELIEQRST